MTITDDGRDPAGLPLGFDFEGVAKQRVPLVEAGICRGVVYDAQTAARDGVRSTGHGLPAPNAVRPVPAEHGHERPGRRRATSSSAAWIAACS